MTEIKKPRVGTEMHRVIEAAKKILTQNPDGLQHKDLQKAVEAALPDSVINHYTRWSYVSWLADKASDSIYKTGDGRYYLRGSVARAQPKSLGVPVPPLARKYRVPKYSEKDFEKPFALFLKDELRECTVAESVGEKRDGEKWSSPDVIGVLKPKSRGLVGAFYTFPPEVVSAEIKFASSSQDLIAAFGQACAYKRFSHKSYLVIPTAASEDDIERLDALCAILGIGLVLFDKQNPEDPKWFIRARARKQDPDFRHLDDYIGRINKKDKKLARKLFSPQHDDEDDDE